MKKAAPQYQQSSPSQGQSTTITIRGHQVPIIEYQGQRVATLAMIDGVHKRPAGTAKRNFNENKARLSDGEDYFLVSHSQKDEIRTFGINIPPRGLTLVTESGYLMLVKSFTDDLAWEVQRQLVRSYFRPPAHANPVIPDFSNPAAAARAWAEQYEQRMLMAATVEEQAAKIDALQSLFKEGMSPAEFCKGLNGVNMTQVCSHLESRGWLFNESKTGTRWRVASYARDRYMTERQQQITPSSHEPFIRYTPILLRKGAERLFELYLKNELPMKKTWDRQHTHNKAERAAS